MAMCEARPRARSGAAAMLLGAAVAFHAPVVAAQSAPAVKLGIVTFLSGPAAGPFGIPARNAAELTIEAINKGEMPSPYATKGLPAAHIDPSSTARPAPPTQGLTLFPSPQSGGGLLASTAPPPLPAAPVTPPAPRP